MKFKYKLFSLFSRFIPNSVRACLRSAISFEDYDQRRRIEANPFSGNKQEDFAGSKFCFGIVEDKMQYHKYYIAACRELNLSYRVLSILDSDWVREFSNCGCDAFLVWPTIMPTSLKEAFDYRLYILEKEMGKMVFPSWKECWLTEHKPRLRDWLEANSIPHPKTWVFYNKNEALKFAEISEFPVVVKTATGAAASGVSVVQNKFELIKIIKLAFGRGLRPRSYPPNDRQRGFIYIQKYYPNVKEWRMVRVGGSFFGYRKESGNNGINSGSKAWSWLKPKQELLDLTRKITQVGNFDSMDVDIFVTEQGDILVNECQTVFGCTTPATQMKVDGKPARYTYQNGSWVLEEGDFCRNHMCNLRVKHLAEFLQENAKSVKTN
ncbi:ATP-grasp domain-containing protein [Sedimentisphaera salicampi]|uniref:ATP-grasp domain-containing protein n=1 Tax=Sedimentisphaera salicampi TaxID=1941349 RepID=UPI000B9A2C4A|nr:hypothetical protein [Sedimentisphaera salicampi]OXU15571.1 carbamoyl phosphate synthase-like protein [Sedimentisphaera salicampi]